MKNYLESEIEDHLCKVEVFNELLVPNYFGVVTEIKRQEMFGPFGRADLVGISETKALVVEIKAEPLEVKDLNQICRYMFAIEKMWKMEVHGLLLGPCFRDCMEMVFIAERIKNLDMKYYEVSLKHGLQVFNTDKFSNIPIDELLEPSYEYFRGKHGRQ